MTIEEIDSRGRYKKGLIAYGVIMYIIAMLISMLLMNLYTNLHNIDVTIFNEILASGDYSSFLETIPAVTIHAIKFLSINNLFIYIILIAALCFLLKNDFINDSEIFKKENIKKSLISIGINTIVFFGLYYLTNILCELLRQSLDINNSANQEFIELALNYGAIPMILSSVVLGPIVEELVFRKCIFGLFENKKIALLVSTFTFAIIHVISSLSLGYSFIELLVITLPYLAAGALFGFIYMKNKCNIYYVIIIHIIINLISVVSLLLI